MRVNKRYNPSRRAVGFTLLEMILAVMVTAIVSVALFASMNSAFKSRRQIEQHLSGKETARSVLTTLREDLVCVPPAGGRISGVFIGDDAPGLMDYDADELTFITANPKLKSDQDLADLRGIQLRLLKSSEDPDYYVLARLVTGNLLATYTPEPSLQVLARRVVSLKIQYYDEGAWLDEWDSTQRDNTLPLAVQIVLVVAPELENEPEDEDERAKTYITMSQIVRLPAAQESTGNLDGGINLGF